MIAVSCSIVDDDRLLITVGEESVEIPLWMIQSAEVEKWLTQEEDH